MARFDLNHLATIAGEDTFEQGRQFAAGDDIEITMVSDDMISALAQDTELYLVVIAGGGRQLSGACDCGDFESAGLCKHMVALAVTVNEMDEEILIGLDERTNALRGYLAQLSPDELAGMLISRAAVDPPLLQQLLVEAGLEGDEEDEEPRSDEIVPFSSPRRRWDA